MSDQGYFFIECLRHALTRGVEDYAVDTAKRRAFVDENGHLIAGTMLVAVFAYPESTLGRNWIQRCGGKQSRELECLRIVRNAFVHTNSHVRDLDRHSVGKEQTLRSFIDDLAGGKVLDDKGNTYPVYMEISDEGVVKMNEQAVIILAALGRVISH